MRKALIYIMMFIFLISTASAATYTVGSTAKYKNIQSAVNTASSGDTIYVNAGTYKEVVSVKGKDLIFQGQKVGNTYKYPTVYGFDIDGSDYEIGGADVNGFKITKSGVSYDYGMHGGNIIRNNYFYNCGVSIAGFVNSDNIIMNNKFSGNYDYTGISLFESYDNSITGNTFSNAKVGLNFGDCATCKTVTKNTFSGCKKGIVIPLYLKSILVGNTYKNNKVNIEYF